MSKLREIVASNLEAWMKGDHELTSQPKVAEAADVAQSHVGRILRRESAATVDMIEKLAKAFDRHPAELLIAEPKKKGRATEAPATPTIAIPLPVKEPATAPYTSLAIQLAELADQMNDNGKWELIGTAKVLARLHPKAKPNRSS